MSKNLMAITFAVFLCCGGVSQGHPLDSPDIVYIDGLPCNGACQSYMKWSRQLTSPAAKVTRHPSDAVRRTSVKRRHGPEAQQPARVARQVAPPATRVAPVPPTTQVAPTPPTTAAEPLPAGKEKANSELADASTTASSPVDDAATRTRTLRERVAAVTALAEQVTMAAAEPAPSQEIGTADPAKSVQSGDAEQRHTISNNTGDNVVALVMARLDIKSVADLAGKDVAIDEQQSASSGVVRTAIAAAGAAEVQLSAGQTKAIDRLIDGEVKAAVLALVSKEAGDWFPEIADYRIFRVPLAPDH
jgi:hypothetical protein